MTSKTERRKRRKGRITMPNAEAVTVKQRGRPHAEDPQAVVIARRLRDLGLPDTPENRAAVRSQMAGCSVGIAIMRRHACADTRADLWGAAQHMRRVWAAYGNAIGAPPRHAQCLRVLSPADKLEASADSPPADDRSDEDRSRAAVSAWMRLQGWLAHTDKAAWSAAINSVVDDAPLRDWEGVERALLCVADGVAGRPIILRARTTS